MDIRRLICTLMVLALPLQGQAVASMSCHQLPQQSHQQHHAVKSPGQAAQAQAAAILHQHADGKTHVHAKPNADTKVAALNAGATDASSESAAQSADLCAACASCCSVSALTPKIISFEHPRVSLAIDAGAASLHPSIEPDRLLRPPRLHITT